MYSRESNLDNTYILYTESISNIPAYIALCGNFLLVYTSENVLNVYNICLGAAAGNGKQGGLARLELVRRISLKGIVARVSRVRSISLFNPFNGGNSYLIDHKLVLMYSLHLDQIHSIENIISANIILLVDGKLIMLCPKTSVSVFFFFFFA